MEENNLLLNTNFVYKHSFKKAFMVNENKIKYIYVTFKNNFSILQREMSKNEYL